VLRAAANANHHFGRGNGFDVPGQDGSIAHLNRVVRGSPQLIAHAATGSIVRMYFLRKVTAIKTFFAEFKDVFSGTELNRLRSRSGFDPIDLDQGPLWY